MSALPLPLPIQLPIARLRNSRAPEVRLRHGADALHAVIKYVALIRLADWERLQYPMPERAIEDTLEKVLAGPAANHWWALGVRLDALAGAWAPHTPAWRGLGSCADLANTGRRFRHHSAHAPADPELADALEDALDRALAAAQPLLALPLLHVASDGREVRLGDRVPNRVDGELKVDCAVGRLVLAPWILTLDSSPTAAKEPDVFLYERLTGTAALYSSTSELRQVSAGLASLDALGVWLREQRREAARRALVGSALVAQPARAQELGRAALARASQHVRAGAPVHVDRPELVTGLDAPWGDGARVIVLHGASGVGKSREAIAWLEREQARGRLAVVLPGVQWGPKDALEDRVATALTGQPIPLELSQLVDMDTPLSLAVDAVNEAVDPDAALAGLRLALATLPSGTRLLVTVRTALLGACMRALSGDRQAIVVGGAMELGPLSRNQARQLWSQAEARGATTWERLDGPTRRMLQLPLFGALAVELGVLGTQARLSLDGVIEAFVASRSNARSRLLLRHVAARMWQSTTDRVDLAGEPDSWLESAVLGDGRLAPAWRELVSDGLLFAPDDTTIRFGHDRIAHWSLSHEAALALKQTAALTLADRVAAYPVLRSALGTAQARREVHAPAIRQLLASTNRNHRRVGFAAVEALALYDPQRVAFVFATWWVDRKLRPVLVEAAARARIAEPLGWGLLHPPSAETALRHVSRLALVDPDLLVEAIREALAKLPRWPMWRPRAMISVSVALLSARASASGRLAAHPALMEATEALARRTLGGLGSVRGFLTRHVAIGILSLLFPLSRLSPPENWPAFAFELQRGLTLPADQRRDLTPLLDLMEGQGDLAAVTDLLKAIAGSGEVVEIAVAERALIAASNREAQLPALGDVCLAIAAAARLPDGTPTMAAQSPLYVLSTWLFRHPAHPRWCELRDCFDALQQAWLACAPDRRWTAASGRRAKALFLAARLGLDELDGRTTGAELAHTLWSQALTDRDRQLAVDVIDDLHIVVATSGTPARALRGLRAVLEATELPPWLEEPLAPLLGSIRARDPALLDDALRGDRGARPTLRGWLDRAPTQEPPGFDLAINFDELLVTRPALTGIVAGVLRQGLQMPSLRRFILHVFKVAANRLTGQRLFGEVPL